jgi:hypothetical protein
MVKKNSILCLVYILVFLLTWRGSYGQDRKSAAPVQKKVHSPGKVTADSTFDFDSLLVIHFHPTAQCSCCINVGNFSKKGLEKFYPAPYKNRRIIFKECNIDEDSSTAKRYKIFDSALGFRKQIKGKEEFKEIESVWEFCEDEEKFLINFREELDRFIVGGEIEIKKTAK